MRPGGIMPRISVLIVVLLCGAFAAGCHDAPGAHPHPGERLPIEPDNPPAPPGPALLDTVKPWKRPPLKGQLDWQLAIAPLDESELRITYRAPFRWSVDSKGRARSSNGLVRAIPVLTPLSDDQVSLAAYIAQLAEGGPIWSRTTPNGYTSYITYREVSVAPSDPNVATRYYHTAVIDVDGRIAKLDVLYDSQYHWRFSDIANAIVATMDVSA